MPYVGLLADEVYPNPIGDIGYYVVLIALVGEGFRCCETHFLNEILSIKTSAALVLTKLSITKTNMQQYPDMNTLWLKVFIVDL